MASFRNQVTTAAVLLFGIVGAAYGQFDFRGPGQQRTAEQLTRVQVVSDVTHPVMGGETVHLAVVYSIEPQWHLYWKNPGEGAPAPMVRVEAPKGWTVGDLRWPRPVVIESAVGDMYCYEGEFALFIPMTAPEELEDGQARFAIDTNWAVCDEDRCLFGSAKRNVSLPTTSANVRTLDARPVNPLIARHRPRLSRPLEGDGFSAKLNGNELLVQVPSHGLEKIQFFPHQSPGVKYSRARFERGDDQYAVVIKLEVDPNNFLDGPPAVGGLITLGDKPDDPSYEFSLPLIPVDSAAANREPEP